MTSRTQLVRIFVASPGDVKQERAALVDVVEELNRTIGAHQDFTLHLVRWETHAWPGFGKDGQDVINGEIGGYDIFVGVMWKRLGTPTGRAPSGTVEEFARAYDLWKQHGVPKLMFYFNQEPVPLGQVKQVGEVLAFKDVLIEKGGLVWDYVGAANFEKQVRGHLYSELVATFARGDVSPTEPPETGVLDVPEFAHLVPRATFVDGLEDLVGDSSVIAVEGLPGSGKTSVVAYALHRAGLAGATMWVDAEQGTTLDDVLSLLAMKIDFKAGSSFNRAKELAHYLVRHDCRLVIDDFHSVVEESFTPLIEAMGRVQPPARLILVSRRHIELSPAVAHPFRMTVGPVTHDEAIAMLQARGVESVPERWVSVLKDELGGLPIAVTLFATAIVEFGKDGDDLLSGNLVGDARLRQWFDDIMAGVDEGSQRLLRFLSMADGAFSQSVVRLAGEQERIANVDASFEELQRAHLVESYSPHRWSVNQLIRVFSSAELDPQHTELIHKAFGDYYLRRVVDWPKQLMDAKAFALSVSACRHFQAASSHEQSQQLLNRLARTTKAQGHFETFLQLCRPELGVPGHDPWLDYHYAHCCLLTGRLCATAEAVQAAKGSFTDPSLYLALVRLHAESLDVAGHPRRALSALSAAMRSSGGAANGMTRRQANAALSRIYLSAGDAPEAARIAKAMLSRARRVDKVLGVAVAQAALGYAFLAMKDSIAAGERLSIALTIFQGNGDRRAASWALAGLVRVALARGDADAAAQAIGEVVRIRSDLTECSSEYWGFLSLAQKIQPDGLDGLIDDEVERVGKLLKNERLAFLARRLHLAD